MNKTAIQSSTYTGHGEPSEARFAFDGNKNQNLIEGKSCSATNSELNSWLQVDLEMKALIRKITIFNRSDCCAQRFENAKVTVADSSDMLQNQTLCVQIPFITTTNNIETFPCQHNVIGRFVRITNGRKDFLNLCEVEVIGTYNIC